MACVVDEQFTANIQQPTFAPYGSRHLLAYADGDPIRPAPRDTHLIDPGQSANLRLHTTNIGTEEARIQLIANGFFDLQCRYSLEGCANFNRLDIAIKQTRTHLVSHHDHEHCEQRRYHAAKPERG